MHKQLKDIYELKWVRSSFSLFLISSVERVSLISPGRLFQILPRNKREFIPCQVKWGRRNVAMYFLSLSHMRNDSCKKNLTMHYVLSLIIGLKISVSRKCRCLTLKSHYYMEVVHYKLCVIQAVYHLWWAQMDLSYLWD